jgi:ABC-2 type transport system permease protein
LPDLARVGTAEVVAYRSEMVIWILTATLPLVMLGLWDAATAPGPVQGFGRDDVARYFVATLLVRQLASAWLVWEVNFDIRSGALSAQLLRPVDPILVKLVPMLAAVPLRVAVLLPLIGAVLCVRPGALQWPGLLAVALFCWSTALAWLLTVLIQAVFASLSFVLDKTDGLFGVYLAVWGLLSGYVAPMAMFPEPVRTALRWLPFRYTLALPVELLAGVLPPEDAVPDLLAQVAWVAALFVGARTAWRAGLRRYGAFGA